jgi:hypothetical protein
LFWEGESSCHFLCVLTTGFDGFLIVCGISWCVV